MIGSSLHKKSLAIAAAGSLSVMGFAAPAQAVDSITLAPLNGTSTGAIVGSTFLMKAAVAGASGDDISFTIEGVDVNEVNIDIVQVASVSGLQASDVTTDLTELQASVADDWGVSSQSIMRHVNDDGVIAVSPSMGSDSLFTASSSTARAAEPYFILAIQPHADDFEDGVEITVTAFEDGNLNGIYDADLSEKKSDSVAVNFIPADEVTGSVSQAFDLDASSSSDDVKVRVVYDNVNMGSMAESSDTGAIARLGSAEVLLNGSVDTNASTAEITVRATDFDDDNNRFERTQRLDGNVGNGDSVVTRAYAGELAVSASNRLGTTRTGLTAEIAQFEDSDHVKASATQNFIVTSAGDADVRPGDGTFTVYVDAEDSDGEAVAAGEDVVFTISEDSNTLDSKVQITAGGLTLTNSDTSDDSESIEVTSKTDGDGRASLTVSYSNLDNSDTFTIDANVDGSTATADLDFEATVDTVKTIDVTRVDSNGEIVETRGSKIELDLALRDNYGLAPASDHRVVYTVSGGEMKSNVTGTVVFPGGTGNATVSWTDSSDAAGDITFAITGNLEEKDSDGDYGTPSGDADPTNVSQTITIVDSMTDVSAVTVDDTASYDSGDAGAEIFGATPVTLNLRDANSTLTTAWQGAFDAGTHLIDADVTDVDGAGVAGVPVTFSAEGVYFSDEAELEFGVDTITAYSDSNGNVVVGYESNIVGEHTVTVTAGGKSDTMKIKVNPSVNDDDVKSWSLGDAPSTVEPQSTLNLQATILDKYGNYVDQGGTSNAVRVTYNGPGIQMPAASTLTETSAKGVVSLSLFFGASDSGTHTVTYEFMGADGNINATDDNVTLQYSFTIGADPDAGYPAGASMNAWTVDQGDGTAKVYIKFPTIDEKLRIGHQKNGSGSYETIYVKTLDSETHEDLTVNVEGSYIVRTIDLVDGTNRIRVTVGDSTEVQVRYNE